MLGICRRRVQENSLEKVACSVNIAKLVTSEFFVSTTLANLLEYNVRNSEFNDNHLLEVSRMCKTLRILSVSGCRITDRGV